MEYELTGSWRGVVGGEMLREADEGREQQHLFLLGAHPSSKAKINTSFFTVFDRLWSMLWALGSILREALASSCCGVQ
jgi:hypothetical protein